MKQRKTDVHRKLIENFFRNNYADGRWSDGSYWLPDINRPIQAGLKFESNYWKGMYEDRRNKDWWSVADKAYEYLYIFDVSLKKADVVHTYNAIAVVDESRGRPSVIYFAIDYGRKSFPDLIKWSVHEPEKFTFARNGRWLKEDRNNVTKAGVGQYEIHIQEKYSRQGYRKAVFHSTPLKDRGSKDKILKELSAFITTNAVVEGIRFPNLKLYKSKVNRQSHYEFVGVEKDTIYGDRYLSVEVRAPKGMSFQDKVDFYRKVIRVLKEMNFRR